MFPLHKHAFCVTATLLITACSKSTQPAQTTVDGQTSTSPSAAQARKELNTLVRFINATQTAKDLYYRVAADRDAAAFTNVPFETVTPYTELPSGRPDAHHEIKLYSASNGVGVPLARNSQVENAGRRYTVLAVNEDGKPALTVITDNLTPPASGKAKVRVIHAAPGIDDAVGLLGDSAREGPSWHVWLDQMRKSKRGFERIWQMRHWRGGQDWDAHQGSGVIPSDERPKSPRLPTCEVRTLRES
jgi:uncharacterized protein DUF4397